MTNEGLRTLGQVEEEIALKEKQLQLLKEKQNHLVEEAGTILTELQHLFNQFDRLKKLGG